MSASITETFKRDLAGSLYNNILSESNYYHIGISRSNQWSNLDEPPTSLGSLNDVMDFRMNLQSVMIGETVSYVVPRYRWSFGTVYAAYDTSVASSSISTPFYVLTEANAVYLCLEQGTNINGEAVTSTVQPTGSSANAFRTADGYTWKFLYTIGGTEQSNFLSANFMPVKLQLETTADSPGTDIEQENIQNAAIPGQILSIKVIDGGEGYESVPNVVIDGDGSGASATATVVNGRVTKIVMDIDQLNHIVSGSDYINARVSLVGGSPVVEAQTEVVIGPKEGVGGDPRKDLKSSGIMFNIKPEGDVGGKFIVGNDFRQIGLIKNMQPSNAVGSELYTEIAGMALKHIQLENTSTAFVPDSIITGGSSGAQGYVDKFDEVNSRIYYHQNDDTGWGNFCQGKS